MLKKGSLADDPWQAVDKSGGEDACWAWTRATVSEGRGYVYDRDYKRPRLATRVLYKSLYGEIPDGMFICHKCDNPNCCNPKHWFLGSSKDNVQDMIAKGRKHIMKPEECFRTKLTREQVSEIRELEAKGDLTNKQIGALYGISGVQVCRISRFKRWKD